MSNGKRSRVAPVELQVHGNGISKRPHFNDEEHAMECDPPVQSAFQALLSGAARSSGGHHPVTSLFDSVCPHT